MAVSKEKLRTEINAILKDADLSVMSAKKVRQTLEEKLSCNLSARKKEVDELVMDFVNSKDNNDESGSEEEAESEEEKPKKRPPPTKKPAAKRSKGGSSEESESGGEEGSDDDYKPQKGAKGRGTPKKRKKNDSESGSDEDWKAPKKAPTKKAAGAAGAGKGKGRGTGFTRAYTLSPELAALMGEAALPRHEVVKKIWAMIKERNLYDPKNKQYAICDSDLLKVMGVKRFRTFGMLKYLREHFLD